MSLARRDARDLLRWLIVPFLAVALCVLSSGPMPGVAFRLRESTHIDNFYAVLWPYDPLLVNGHDSPVMSYIEWWVVDVFDTVGPG